VKVQESDCPKEKQLNKSVQNKFQFFVKDIILPSAKILQKEILKHTGPINMNHRITESQNSRGWKGPLWVI